MLLKIKKSCFSTKGRFLLYLPCKKPSFLKVNFFNEISIFQAVFFYPGVFECVKNNFEQVFDRFSHQNIEFEKPVTVPRYDPNKLHPKNRIP